MSCFEKESKIRLQAMICNIYARNNYYCDSKRNNQCAKESNEIDVPFSVIQEKQIL